METRKLDGHWFMMLFVAVILLVLTASMVGCVSKEDKTQLAKQDTRLIELETQAAAVYDKILDGSLTIAEARLLYDNIRADTKIVADEINILNKKGYNPLEIILAILERLVVIGAAVGVVRLNRGSIHNRKGET